MAAPNLSQAIAELQSPNHAHLAPLGTADSNNGFVCAAADIPLRSVANGEYVSAELAYSGDQYGMLRARTAAAPGPWEQFQ
ncbi:hypothetical protein [Kitasatospora aureofaciens]|uniref:hypothetical protein n=1 Tax=Kitasatospora aureofaciens TaxID=1894 RepID=UPI0038280569